jgi:hypothetical protein
VEAFVDTHRSARIANREWRMAARIDPFDFRNGATPTAHWAGGSKRARFPMAARYRPRARVQPRKSCNEPTLGKYWNTDICALHSSRLARIRHAQACATRQNIAPEGIPRRVASTKEAALA